MDVLEKLRILTDAAKYDVACTSSGVDRGGKAGHMGNAVAAGICHSFAADGRCISLLKILLTNHCVYDCKYCLNRSSREVERVAFTPEELAELTMNFYRRNYIEGLFLSSGVWKNPDYTTEQMIKVLTLIRHTYRFNGYIHVKAIPGADEKLLSQMGLLADRMSVNIELPTEDGLKALAPQKNAQKVISPMRKIADGIAENRSDLTVYRHAPRFVPAGQSTQMIIGATPESDHQILALSEGLYKKYSLKRVFFSAYTPVVSDPLLPSLLVKPPLLREHRLYQADWLMRFYGFAANEIVNSKYPNMNLAIDPKCNWALRNMNQFPVEVNKASYEMLLRVPGIGMIGAKKILQARRVGSLDFSSLKKLGIVLKRARFFLLCKGKADPEVVWEPNAILRGLLSKKDLALLPAQRGQQMSFSDLAIEEKEDEAKRRLPYSGTAFSVFPENSGFSQRALLTESHLPMKKEEAHYEFGIRI